MRWEGSNTVLIVLTQECDLHHGKQVELVFAKSIKKSKIDKRKLNTKNMDFLHLLEGDDCWELDVRKISVIDRAILEGDSSFKQCSSLSADNLEMCKIWRIRSYNRVPFPEEFQQHFFKDYLWAENTGFECFLFQYRANILELYAQIGDSPVSGVKLSVSITAVISDDTSRELELEIAKKLKYHLKELDDQGSLAMLQVGGQPTTGNEFELANRLLTARPEDFTLADIQATRQLRLDAYCWPS